MSQFILTVVLPLLVLLATAAAGEPNYALLNSLLNDFNVNIDTSNVPPIEKDLKVVKIRIRIGKEATCTKLSVGSASIDGKIAPGKTQKDNISYDRYDVSLGLNGVKFTCTVGVCIDHKFFIGGWIQDSDCGSATIQSSNSNFAVTEGVLTTVFGGSDSLPAGAQNVPKPCHDMAQLNGITFSGHNIATIVGIDITGILVDQLNGPYKNDALDPIRQAICDGLASLGETIDGIAVTNPLSEFLQEHMDGENVTGPLALEKQLHANLPESVKLVDLDDNPVTNLLFPNRQDGKIEISNSMVKGIFSQLGANETVQLDMISIISKFLDIDLKADTQIDMLPVVEKLLNQDQIRYNFSLSGLGQIDLALQSLKLELNSPKQPNNSVIELDLIGQQTIALPGLSLGDFHVLAGVDVLLNVATTELLDQEIKFELSQTALVELDWEGFLLQVAVLVAIDSNSVLRLQLQPLYDALLDCALSTFYTPTTLTGVVASGSKIDLSISGFTDAIAWIVGDLFNTLFPLYQGVLPSVLESIVSKEVDGTKLLQPTTCTRLYPTAELTTTPYDFGTGMIHSLSNALSTDTVQSVLETALPATDANDTRVVDVVNENNYLSLVNVDLGVLGADAKLSIDITKIALSLVPSRITHIALLSSVNKTQYLNNEVGANSLSVSVDFKIKLGTELNILGVTLDLNTLHAIVALLAAYSRYDIEGRELRNLLKLDCWIGDLKPFGGIKELILDTPTMGLEIECSNCETAVFVALAEKLSNSEDAEKLLNIVSKGKDHIFGEIESNFSPEQWNFTIVNAQKRCNGKSPSESNFIGQQVYRGSADSTNNVAFDETAYPIVAVLMFTVLVAGVLTCCVPMCRRKKDQPADKVKVMDPSKANESIVKETGRSVVEMPMWNNPALTKCTRVLVPALLVINLALFVLGHMAVIMKIAVKGNVADVPFEMEFAEFSVLSSTKQIWGTGSYALAVIIFLVSICWPYVKLVGLSLCWFLPVRFLSCSTRGMILNALDALGKWSLLELYVVAFVFVAFNIQIESPMSGDMPNEFLPPGIFNISLIALPQYSLFTFTTALLLSLFMGNVMVVSHGNICSPVSRIDVSNGSVKLSVYSTVMEENRTKGRIMVWGLVFLGLVAATLTLVGAALVTLVLEMNGVLASLFRTISLLTTTFNFTTYKFVEAIFTEPVNQPYFGLAVVFTVLIVPTLQLMLMAFMMLVPLTYKQARRLCQTNHILCSWCATEVFLFGIGLVVFEIGQITAGLLGSACDTLMPFFQNVLLPIGLISEEDIDAGCLSMSGYIGKAGAGVLLTAIVLAYFTHYCSMKLFYQYLEKRANNEAVAEKVGIDQLKDGDFSESSDDDVSASDPVDELKNSLVFSDPTIELKDSFSVVIKQLSESDSFNNVVTQV